MNSFASSTSTSSGGYLRQAVVLTLFLSLFGILSFSVFGTHLSLRWLPLLVVALWPRGASPIFSVVALLLLGLFQDWLGFGVPGQWSLIYLLVFALTRPFERLKPLHFGGGIVLWLIAVGVAAVTITISGRLIYGQWPNWVALFQPALVATCILPFVWALRQSLHRWFARREAAA